VLCLSQYINFTSYEKNVRSVVPYKLDAIVDKEGTQRIWASATAVHDNLELS